MPFFNNLDTLNCYNKFVLQYLLVIPVINVLRILCYVWSNRIPLNLTHEEMNKNNMTGDKADTLSSHNILRQQ